MSRALNAALGIALCGGAIALYAYGRNSTTAELQRLDRELAELRAARPARSIVIREVHPEAPTVRGETDPVEGATSESNAGADTFTPEEAAARSRQRAELRVNSIRERYESEAADPAWSREAEAKLIEQCSVPEFEVLRTSVTCKSTVCRLDYSYSDLESGPAAVQQIMSLRPWPGTSSQVFDWETRTGTTFYGREGHELFANVDGAALGD